jgi:hypothetical protein
VTDPTGSSTPYNTPIGGPARFAHTYLAYNVNIGNVDGVWTIGAFVNGAVKMTRTITVSSGPCKPGYNCCGEWVSCHPEACPIICGQLE